MQLNKVIHALAAGSPMKVAFYKGTRKGLAGLFNILARWWLNGPYSHCELVFPDGSAASSSFLDKGVRFKSINFDPAKWDMVEVGGNQWAARSWFLENEGAAYDTWGLIGFLYRATAGERSKYFCSEAVMLALGYTDAWRFDPCICYHVLKGGNARNR